MGRTAAGSVSGSDEQPTSSKEKISASGDFHVLVRLDINTLHSDFLILIESSSSEAAN